MLESGNNNFKSTIMNMINNKNNKKGGLTEWNQSLRRDK